jgi:SAM-dependent methyltransferase
MKVYSKISKCRICKNKLLHKVFDLGSQFIQGSFVKKNYPSPHLKKIPLKLVLCKKCYLLQTLHTTKKSILYKNYWYMSKINQTMRNHLKKIVRSIHKNKRNKKKINVLDIGCNDGTLLNYYPKSISKYGIDPSQIVNEINKKKINVIRDYFPPKKNKLKKLNIKFNIITSIAMFYDVDDPSYFVKKIKYFLDREGIWVFELSYMIDMIKLNSFDTICHEHLEYYSLSTLKFLMEKNGLKIINVFKNSINGGSIKCYVTHKENIKYDKKNNFLKIKKLLQIEKKIKIGSTVPYKKFYKNCLNIKNNLNKLIQKIIKQKKTIFILGASTKGNTILQFLNIDHKTIKYAVERNTEKIGATTIGSKIEIISEKKSSQLKPDYYLVLPWHFKKEIIQREKKYISKGGSLIFPLPKISIINKNNYKNYS